MTALVTMTGTMMPIGLSFIADHFVPLLAILAPPYDIPTTTDGKWWTPDFNVVSCITTHGHPPIHDDGYDSCTTTSFWAGLPLSIEKSLRVFDVLAPTSIIASTST